MYVPAILVAKVTFPSSITWESSFSRRHMAFVLSTLFWVIQEKPEAKFSITMHSHSSSAYSVNVCLSPS